MPNIDVYKRDAKTERKYMYVYIDAIKLTMKLSYKIARAINSYLLLPTIEHVT